MNVICKCGEEFVAKERDCPQGKEGCLVIHWDLKSFICPNCEFNTWSDFKNRLFVVDEATKIKPETSPQLEFKFDE